MAGVFARRAFLKLLATGAAGLATPGPVSARQEPGRRQIFTYKTVGKCEIKADVYGASADAARPVVIWIHGGALIMGDRGGIDRRLRDLLLKAGYAVVSGLAAGIDTAAHRATLDAGGRTLAVIGTGLGRAYPPQNAELQQRIAREHAVISQFWPQSPPTRRTFPMRNATTSSNLCAAASGGISWCATTK